MIPEVLRLRGLSADGKCFETEIFFWPRIWNWKSFFFIILNRILPRWWQQPEYCRCQASPFCRHSAQQVWKLNICHKIHRNDNCKIFPPFEPGGWHESRHNDGLRWQPETIQGHGQLGQFSAIVHYPLPRTVTQAVTFPEHYLWPGHCWNSVEIEIVLVQPLSIRPYIQSVNIRNKLDSHLCQAQWALNDF